MKKKTRKTILSLTNKLLKYTRSVKQNYDADIIHELRTTFKKLRALLRWQNAGKQSWADYKIIYAAAGELRNIQVIADILNQEEKVPQSFRNWLSVLTGKVKKNWNNIDYKKGGKQFSDSINNLQIKAGKNKSFFSKRINRINEILANDPVTDVLLHEMRKMIKDMQYVLEWWKRKTGKPQQLLDNISISKLENIAKLIGDYNDKRIVLAFLVMYAEQEKNADAINEINPLINKWHQIKSEEKEKLVSILRYEKMNMPQN